ncbi:MAG: HAD-IIB family hydrolase [Oscillospiraceae bacterium]|nr:HAD-IIB family hydrolase [Oscillospiraceae bacterium]
MFSDVLLTVDFDRTLTAPDSTIPQRNLDAIQWFMENGGKFTVNTGRSVPMSQGRLLPQVPVNAPLLLYNGSAGYDKETGTLTQPCPIDLPITLLQSLQDRFSHLHVEVQAQDAHYLLHEDAGWERFCAFNGCAWKYASLEEIPGPFLKFSVYGQFREQTVSSMYQVLPGEVEQMEETIRWVMERWGEKLVFFRSATRITDFHAAGCSKGNSGRALQKALGRKYLVCVGDAENDLTMLDNADYAFCPSDGVIADRYENVCDCAQGAVADVIYKKIPEILAIQP